MNATTKVVTTMALLLAATAALLPAVASAQAPVSRQPVDLAVAAPEDVPLGNQARIVAVLRDAEGNPIPGASIVFASPAAFAGTIGEMEIGDALTDSEGIATLDYQLRIQGPNQFMARFYGDAIRQPAEAASVVQAAGQVQIAQRTAGVNLPVLGAWTIVAVLAGVWSVYFTALLLVTGIPESRGSRLGPETGGQR